MIKPVEVTHLFFKYIISPEYLALVAMVYLPRPGFNRFGLQKLSGSIFGCTFLLALLCTFQLEDAVAHSAALSFLL